MNLLLFPVYYPPTHNSIVYLWKCKYSNTQINMYTVSRTRTKKPPHQPCNDFTHPQYSLLDNLQVSDFPQSAYIQWYQSVYGVAIFQEVLCTHILFQLTLKVLYFWKFTSYCSLKPLWSGMGEVVLARTSPTLHPHPLSLCINCRD